MLGKSFKMMPVMVWGIIISGKTYGSLDDSYNVMPSNPPIFMPTIRGMRDWSVALAVTLGCTEFLMTGSRDCA